jgi:hypothetical protein
MASDSLSGIVTAIATVVYTVATLGLLVGAVIAARYAKRTWEGSVRAELSAQASQIAGWLQDESDAAGGPTGKYLVIVGNASRVPVYDLSWAVNGYGELVVPDIISGHMGVLMPHPRVVVTGMGWALGDDILATPDSDEEVLARRHDPGDFRVELTFRDASGARWKRHDDGRLEQLGP